MSNSKKEFNNSALVVNLFGVPSSGKSTGAAYLCKVKKFRIQR